MAIFSQAGDNDSKIDFRSENPDKRNRRVPYSLPIEIERKLHQLMVELNLNSGSFDIVRTVDNKYVFLEVNPVGQFGMVSVPCNYNLEKIIAELLIVKNNEKRRV